MRLAFTRFARRVLAPTTLLAVAAGCRGHGEPPVTALAPSVVAAGDRSAADASSPRATVETWSDAGSPSPIEPVLLVSDPATLVDLESNGAAFGKIAFGVEADSTRELGGDPMYRSLVAQIARDLAEVRASDPKSGVGMRYAHRLFDAHWLESSDARFELTGIVNRLDRRPFHTEACGETRLVYRLSYRTDRGGHPLASRLPMTVNVVFWQDPDGPMGGRTSPANGDGTCHAAAQRWLPSGPTGALEVARFLRGPAGPLSVERLGPSHLKAIEVNVQSVRWPSTVRPDMAGHSEYLLRVFHRDPTGKRLVAAPLENTPDVDALRRNARRRAALLAWLRRPDNLAAIDAGIALLPAEFTSTKAISVTPRGFARRANRPFSQLFKPSDFSDLPLGYPLVRSTDSLLRRLDQMSCGGCHQTRSLAGFHLLGDERDPERPIDALFVSSSPHLDGDLERRRAYVRAILDGAKPKDLRPFADHERRPGYGSHCGLGDPSFAALTCADDPGKAPTGEGLSCVDVGEASVGACLPSTPEGPGGPCEIGRVIADDDPRRDRVGPATSSECPRLGSCFSNYGGFPGGMCALACGVGGADSACGKIAILRDFNACLGKGVPFDVCVRDNADPASMRACDRDHTCRDDYICAKASSTRGVCIPPYFLFQLRVDGHLP